ncbi:hypothetical protein B0H13DRAFT_2677072 [Mycena leptocephala]|nr:hypothetical protein B0H13DRAFT_2677072 [Mycena leptocephala]
MYPEEIPTLLPLRVARRVLVWIRPLLYRVLRVTLDNAKTILKAIKSKPADFFPKTVRHLWLDGQLEHEGIQILEVCRGVVNLQLPYGPATPTFLLILAEMPLQQLSACLHPLFGGSVEANHPLFASITHLDLFDYDMEHLTQILAEISAFPALTHLSLFREPSQDTIENVLGNCPRMQILLVLWPWYASHEYKTANIPQITTYASSSECTRTTRVIGKLVQRAYRISGRTRMTL